MIRPPRATDAHRWSATTIAFAAILVASAGHAGETEASLTEQLFLEGKALMKEGQYEKACAKFAASHKRDQTATGTLLNLALCHEALGKTATAWAEFRRAAAESARTRPDRVAFARSHEASLFPTLSYLRIVVAPAARTNGLVVRLDQAPIEPATWDTEIPVDPGLHDLEVSAQGKKTRRDDVPIEGPASHRTFVVSPLADAPPPPVVDRIRTDPGAGQESPGASRRRRLGYVLGGAGVAALGAGAVFGVIASNHNHDVNRLCPGDQCPTSQERNDANSALSSAKQAATASSVLIGAGVLLVVSGAVLVITSTSSSGRKTSSSLSALLWDSLR